MKGLDYPTVKALYDARRLLAKYPGICPEKRGDRTYAVGHRGGFKEPSEQVLYSQQEFTIYPSDVYRDYDSKYVAANYPDGVGRTVFRHPHKEYIHCQDATGVVRYYVMPDTGLRLQKDGQGYKVMNAVPDYRIVVDRAKAKEARQPAEDLYNFVDVLWDMLPEPENGNRPDHPIEQIPAIDDREAWHTYVNAAKYARWKSYSKSTVLQRIRTEYTEKALAYRITQVPNTQMDHTEHWDKLEELRAAGKLEMFEGPVKKKRQTRV